MDHSNYFLLKNRVATAYSISALICASTLLIINSMLPTISNEKQLSPLSISLTYQQPVVEKKPIVKPEPTPLPEKKIEPKKEPIPDKVAEPIIEPIKEATPVAPIQESKTNVIEATAIETSPKNITVSRLTDYSVVSAGLTLPQPEYPRSAIKLKKQGIVEIEIEIGLDGSVRDIKLIKSSGHKVLDNLCIKVVKKSWKFNKGKTTVITRKRFEFKLI